MKLFKIISGVDCTHFADSVYQRLLVLTGLAAEPKLPSGMRSSLSFEMEVGDPRLAMIEALLIINGLSARPAFATDLIDWDAYMEESKKYYNYEMRKIYEFGDLESYQYATTDCLVGLIDEGDELQTFIDAAALMGSDTGKVIADQKVASALSEILKSEVDFSEVVIRKGNRGTLLDGYVWMKPRSVMPAISKVKNRFFDFDGQPCSYGNKEGFSVFKHNYTYPELIYERADFPEAGLWKIARTKEDFGFHVRRPYTIWSSGMIKVLYRLELPFHWYPVHFV